MNEIEIKNMLISLSRSLKPDKGELEYAMERYPSLILEEIHKTGKDYDMKQLENEILKTRKYKTFPPLAEVLEHLPEAAKRKFAIPGHVENEGATVRVTYASGRYTDFTICGYGSILKDLIARFYKADNIVKAVMYPKGVTLIGSTIFWGDIPESQEKLLYKAGTNEFT